MAIEPVQSAVARRSITHVTATPIAIPLESPVRWSTRTVAAREYLLVRIEAGPLVGSGFTYTGVGVARSMATFVRDVLAPRLVGHAADSPTRPWAGLFQETILAGRRGFAVRAISAVDLALWDLLGQVCGLPLARLLGGVADAVPAYASGGYYRDGDPLESIDREVNHYLGLGFKDVKIKVGGLDPTIDAQRVEQARSLVGPHGRVALDANNAWTTLADAVRFLRMVEPYDPWWLEEPFAPDDVAKHAELRQRTSVPIATGEIHATRWDFAELISRRAADILQPDVAVIGGVSEWMRVAHTAASFDIPVAPHWNHEVHVHMAAAVPNSLAVEWFDLSQDIVNFERVLRDPIHASEGRLEVPERPGSGLRFDDEAVSRYAIA